ncbi:hypothetical protein C8R45DRAFT_920497 [Mycena sanguinolenta]|nr:hypothetical protein C8R45DRAFT_920497 [Mycena sanguinolenta]
MSIENSDKQVGEARGKRQGLRAEPRSPGISGGLAGATRFLVYFEVQAIRPKCRACLALEVDAPISSAPETVCRDDLRRVAGIHLPGLAIAGKLFRVNVATAVLNDLLNHPAERFVVAPGAPLALLATIRNNSAARAPLKRVQCLKRLFACLGLAAQRSLPCNKERGDACGRRAVATFLFVKSLPANLGIDSFRRKPYGQAEGQASRELLDQSNALSLGCMLHNEWQAQHVNDPTAHLHYRCPSVGNLSTMSGLPPGVKKILTKKAVMERRCQANYFVTLMTLAVEERGERCGTASSEISLVIRSMFRIKVGDCKMAGTIKERQIWARDSPNLK